MTETARVDRPPMDGTQVDVVVVGAGFGGLYALHELRARGFSVQGFEAASDVGGTWWWNRYPGARCDIPSLFYSYKWSDDLQKDWRWTETYAAQPEILAYANHVADRFDLRPLIAFDTRVTRAQWDEAPGLWRIETDRGDRLAARFVVMATGCLSTPRPPAIPGVESFGGATYHTGAWPHDGVDFSGRRVGVIGTGSSAIQAIPLIAQQAARLTVFQRTANFSVPARNRALSERDVEAFWKGYDDYMALVKGPGFGFGGNPANQPPATPEERKARYEELWAQGGAGFLAAWGTLLTDIEVNEDAASFVRDKIRQIVRDPATAEALAPKDHPIGTKRICVDTGYYETFNRPNVELVDLKTTPIAAIRPKGVETRDRLFELDDLVFATGFDAMTGTLLAVEIVGVDGLRLREAWAEGPKAYLGLAIAGFPNLFTLTGPGSPSVLSNMINSIEQHVEWIARCLTTMGEQGRGRIEADATAQEDWVAHGAEVAARTLFPRAASWYMGANIPGKPRVFMPYIGAGYRARCEAVAAGGYQGFALA